MLSLPSGWVDVWDNGALFSFGHHWVVALGLDEKTFMIVRERDERFFQGKLLHELMGFLVAHNCELIPIDFRCPVTWRHGGSLDSVRRLWAARFFEEGDTLLFQVPMPLSERPILALPLSGVAADGFFFWEQAGLVAEAMFSETETSTPQLRAVLTRISTQWEQRWNVALAQLEDPESGDQINWFQKCDEAWAKVVRDHLEPYGYRMNAASMARLL